MSVSDLLTELGFKPFSKGWFYLCDCIALLKSDPTAKLTAVYYAVGKRYGVDARAVERLCRHTILATLLRSRHGVFETVYENGERVYVNYSQSEVTVNGVEVPARGFVKGASI